MGRKKRIEKKVHVSRLEPKTTTKWEKKRNLKRKGRRKNALATVTGRV
jgi:hypothetical protein